MQLKNRHIKIFSLLVIGLMLINISIVSGWNDSEMITSHLGDEAPTIDGVKEDLWTSDNVNITYNTFSGRQITLSVQHYGSGLFILIELKNYETSQQNETFSIYMAPSNQTDDSEFTDKKQLTMLNASQKGNETSEFTDLHKKGSSYVEDTEPQRSYGVAKYSTGFNRNYEFNISRFASNGTENNNITVGNNYAFKVGYKSGNNAEEVSVPLIIQVGPRVTSTDEDFGEWELNWTTFSQIVHWVVLGIVGLFGLLILKNFGKVQKIQRDIEKHEEED